VSRPARRVRWLTQGVSRRESARGADSFVLDVVRSYASGGPCPQPPMDERWVDAADAAGVLPIVLDQLQRAGHPLPSSVERARYRGVATYLRALVDLRDVAAPLDRAGVRWVLLKGAALAQVVYDRPAVRWYSDLDVLVHPEDLGVALEVLEQAGFSVLDRNWELIAATGRGEISLETRAGNLLDLHWHLINDRRTRRAFAVDVSAMMERRVVVDIDGLAVPILDPLDTVLHVALHASLAGGHRLLWLLDLHQAIRWSGCDLQTLNNRAAEMNAQLPLRAMLKRTSQFVDPSLDSWATRVPAPAPWAGLCAIVSALAPPLGVRRGRRTGRLVFSSTRATTAASLLAVVRAALTAVRDGLPFLEHSVDLPQLQSSRGTEADRDSWVAGARRSA
jgi:hypothetical protein